MNIIFDTIARLVGQVTFWVMVEPWEQAIRVRAGKHVRRLAPGFHWRVPVLDVVYKQSVRWRSALISTQTLSTSDGATLITSGTIGYVIADIERLYRRLHHAEDTIVQLAAGAIATEVMRTERAALAPETVSANVSMRLAKELAEFGLAEVSLRVTDFAFVRAFRLVQEGRWLNGGTLNTEGGR